MNSRRISFMLLWVLIILLASVSWAFAHELNDGHYVTVFDQGGNAIWYTGWKVNVGDEILTEKNERYQVHGVAGNYAVAHLIGTVDLSAYAPPTGQSFLSFVQRWWQYSIGVQQDSKGKIDIYHTHSDESYVPSDGKESILGAGGIYQVGQAFAQALQQKGLQVFQSQAKHDPHDDMAYERSRRTAADLIAKDKPDAIFDVHRDATPPQVYTTTINGQDVTKLNLVVGKYNPTEKSNEDFALNLKAVADKQYPGLVRGIFFAKGGDYNQDLHPRALLLEVGAHTNSKAEAERGIQLFSDVVPTVLGYTGGGPSAPGAAAPAAGKVGQSGAGKAVAWVLGLTLAGVIGYLVISTGSMSEAGGKVRRFVTTEFAHFMGRLRTRGRQDEDNRNQ